MERSFLLLVIKPLFTVKNTKKRVEADPFSDLSHLISKRG